MPILVKGDDLSSGTKAIGQDPKKSLGLPGNPKKSLDQKLTPKKPHADFVALNPLSPKGPPFDESNRLALDRVKSISHSWGVKG